MTTQAPPQSQPGDPEARRIAALEALELVGSAREREFDAIVGLAATLFDAPIAAVTLLDGARQWTKSALGACDLEGPREHSFCTHTIRSNDTMIVPDADADRRFDARREALGGAHDIRFYAGVPIHAPTGERIGALCVADPRPRAFDDDAEQKLRELAMLVDALVGARATARDAIQIAGESARQAEHLRRQERVMLQAERLAMIGSWRLTIADDSVEWSDNTYRIHGLPVSRTPSVEQALDFFPPHARAVVAQALATTIETGAPMDVEVDFVTAQKLPRKVRSIGELECQGGLPVAVVGIFQDVTERWTLEQQLRRSADRDALTGIANRAAFDRALARALGEAVAGTPLLLALVDLDGFKATNDTHGHLAGDDVLKAIGRRLEHPWLEASFAARLGGDEFALLVTERAFTDDPAAFADRLERELAKPVVSAGGGVLPCTGTVGTALFDPAADTARDLMHRADTALYAAKRRRTGERRRSERRAG